MSSDASRPSAIDAPSIVDLFAGPGGLDVAAHWLDVPVAGVEWDDNAVATRKKASLNTWHSDVRDLGPWNFPDANVLAGGPPCQTFTVAGAGAGRRALDVVLALVAMLDNGRAAEVKEALSQMEDERTGLVLEPLRWALSALDDERPFEAIVLEQVPAVKPVWDAYAAVLRNRGYGVDVGILRTEEFGVPQTRRRAILIARLGAEVSLPAATHRPYRKGVLRNMGAASLRPWVPMAEALSGRGDFDVISNYGSGGISTARGRRSSDQPAFTVTGKISRNKVVCRVTGEVGRFSPSEAGQLQTFPADYPWSGGDIAQQIGNAVPPRLAAHVLSAALGMDQPSETFLADAVRSSWRDQVRGTTELVPVA
ncbi:DNA cytosine methyltransferase [Rhodococcus sp. ACT016]|uniref:DNA cytosine methyltransferase n=1 Tax=Rhodococcus sp. ACT016 TaxID=3134808 RepID=UPI003D299380